MPPVEGGDDGSETDSENDSAVQTTLDEFSSSDLGPRSSLFQDGALMDDLRSPIEVQDGRLQSPFHSSALRAFEQLSRSTERMSNRIALNAQRAFEQSARQTVRRVQRASVPNHMTKVMGTALASSVVGSAAVAAGDPSVFNALSHPWNFGAEQVVATQSQPLMADLIETLRRTGIEVLMKSVAPLSSLPAIEDFTSLNQHVVDQFTPLAKQLSQMDAGVVGAGAMGATAAQPDVGQEVEVPDPWQAFEQPEILRSSAQPEPRSVPEPSPPLSDQDLEPSWWPGEQVRDCSSEIMRVYVLSVADFSMGGAYVLYPEYRTMILLSSPLLMIPLHWALLLVWPTD